MRNVNIFISLHYCSVYYDLYCTCVACSKLFLYQLEQMFQPSNSTPECPNSGAGLHRWVHSIPQLTSLLSAVAGANIARSYSPHNSTILYTASLKGWFPRRKTITTMQQTDCKIILCDFSLICTHRLTVDRTGRVVYSHEADSSWDINKHIQSLQQREGLTPRDIYWRLWGAVNTLTCVQCRQVSTAAVCSY